MCIRDRGLRGAAESGNHGADGADAFGAEAGSIVVKAQGGVRYTVPSTIRPDKMDEEQIPR